MGSHSPAIPTVNDSLEQSGLRLLPRTKNAEDNGDNFVRCNLGTERLVAHTAPVGCRVAHFPVVAGRTFRTMSIETGSVLLLVTHTGAVERITSASVTITRHRKRTTLGHVAEGRDYECRKGRVQQVSKRNVRYVNARPAPTEALKDAEDAAATMSSTTRPVASELSRKIFTCAFVLVVACSRLAVKSHEGHSSSGSDSNVTAAAVTICDAVESGKKNLLQYEWHTETSRRAHN